MNNNINRQSVKWINCAKCIGIIAVITDHSYGILYNNYNIDRCAYFSVSLFVLISGILSYYSCEKHKLSWGRQFIHSGKSIAVAYLIANAVYLVYSTNYFDLVTYIQYVVRFDLAGPFYYVAVYLQLMLMSKILYSAISKAQGNLIYNIGIGLGILLLSSLTTNYTNLLPGRRGDGFVLGGTYLFIFYVGMLLSKYRIFDDLILRTKNQVSKHTMLLWELKTIVFFFLFLGWFIFECKNALQLDSKLPFGVGINPPSISLFVMAIIILFFSYNFFTLLLFNQYTYFVVTIFNYIGEHTLYIFLYHRLFLDYVLPKYCVIQNIVFKRFVYYMTMILGPILIEYIIKYTRNWLLTKSKVSLE